MGPQNPSLIMKAALLGFWVHELRVLGLKHAGHFFGGHLVIWGFKFRVSRLICSSLVMTDDTIIIAIGSSHNPRPRGSQGI